MPINLLAIIRQRHRQQFSRTLRWVATTDTKQDDEIPIGATHRKVSVNCPKIRCPLTKSLSTCKTPRSGSTFPLHITRSLVGRYRVNIELGDVFLNTLEGGIYSGQFTIGPFGATLNYLTHFCDPLWSFSSTASTEAIDLE